MYLQTRSSPFCLLIYIAPLFFFFCESSCSLCSLLLWVLCHAMLPPYHHHHHTATLLTPPTRSLSHSLSGMFLLARFCFALLRPTPSHPTLFGMERKIDVIRMCILTNSPVFRTLLLILSRLSSFPHSFFPIQCSVSSSVQFFSDYGAAFASFFFAFAYSRLIPLAHHTKNIVWNERKRKQKKMRKKHWAIPFSYLNKDSTSLHSGSYTHHDIPPFASSFLQRARYVKRVFLLFFGHGRTISECYEELAGANVYKQNEKNLLWSFSVPFFLLHSPEKKTKSQPRHSDVLFLFFIYNLSRIS